MSKKRDFDSSAANERATGQQLKRLKRTYDDKDAALARIYEDLANDDGATRQSGTLNLMQQLTEPSQELVARIETRLIRGLCSNRKSARLGFFVALAEFWRLTLSSASTDDTFGGPKITVILARVTRLTTPEGGASNQEKRDHAFGRLTAIKALIHSGAVCKSGSIDEDTSLLVEEIFLLANDSAWFREQAGMVLCEALRLFDGHAQRETFAAKVLSSMVEHHMAKTPEGIAIWLVASCNLPKANLPKKVWHHSTPLSRKELSTVSSIMRQEQSPSDDSQASKKSNGARQRMPHFSWEIIISAIFKDNEDCKADSRFETFWNEALDKSYFSSGASPERKSVGFQVLIKALVLVPASAMPRLFGHNVMGCLMNQSSKPERLLHAMARSVLKACEARATVDAAAAQAILRALLTGNGSLAFDRLTNTKTVQNILAMVNDATASGIVEMFQSQLEDARSGEAGAEEQTQRLIADMLLQMCRGRSTAATQTSADVREPPTWLSEITWLFASIGLLSPEGKDYSSATQDLMKSRLSSALATIMSFESGLVSTVEYALLKRLEAGKLRILQSASPELRQTIQTSFFTLDKLHTEAGAGAAQTSLLLFSSNLLEALGGSSDALSLLDELVESLGEPSNQSNRQQISTLLDVILGLVSRQSSFHSKLGERVFQGLTNGLSEDDLDAMVDVLEQKETIAGQQALFEQAQNEEVEGSDSTKSDAGDVDVKEMDEDSDADDDDDDDDVELVSAGGSAPSESDANEDEDGAEGSDDDELARFDDKLASLLKTSASTGSQHANGGTEPDGQVDDDGSSDSSMDDEQMMALDSHIIAIFKERAAASGVQPGASSVGKKREKSSAKQNVAAFKNRVLDLLGIYFRAQHASAQAVRLILPLLQLIRTTKSKQIAEKTSNVLQKYFDLAKHKGMPSVATGLDKTCEQIHVEALKFGSKAHAASCSRASLFVARAMLAGATEDGGGVSLSKATAATKNDKKGKRKNKETGANELGSATADSSGGKVTDWLIDLYAKTHRDCLKRSSGLPASFWADWVMFSLNVRRA